MELVRHIAASDAGTVSRMLTASPALIIQLLEQHGAPALGQNRRRP
jgi:hypothetical protein